MLKFNNEHCNVEEMLKVRERIHTDLDDRQFDMRSICGTARCIAGWTVSTKEYLSEVLIGDREVVDVASDKLGLTDVQSDALFFVVPDPETDNPNSIKYGTSAMHDVTRDQAIQAIDNMIADGMPHWQDILA